MADDKPSIYILHGDDAFAIHKYISSMEAKLGDPSMADLNTTRLDGRQASLDDIRAAAFAMPFLADRRLVVVTSPLARFSSKGMREVNPEEASTTSQLSAAARAGREKFLALLDAVPATTALALIIDDARVRRKGEWQWEVLTPTHWLQRWASQAGKRAWIQECGLPTIEEMPGWVRKQVEAMHGQFSPQAVRALAEHVGPDTEMAAQEIIKLLTYVDYKRPVEEDDVTLLTAQTNQASVFTLVDAMGERNGHLALQTLHNLMEENDPVELFGMIVRQFRLLLQAREVLDEGGGIEIISKEVKEKSGGGLHPYVAQKLAGQAQQFTLAGLDDIYRRLLEIDVAVKTSQMPAEVAFDTFIAELAS
jgi:DNA polymerase III subunit delta